VKELELKLLIDEATAGDIWKRALAAKLTNTLPRARQVSSTYVDTPDHRLRSAGISLRVRRDGRRHLQTVKSAASLHGGLSDVMEIENTLPGSRLDLEAIPDEAMRNKITGIVNGTALRPVCTTVVRRTEGEVCLPCGTRAMLAVDAAKITVGNHVGLFHELELEHLAGSPAGLFHLAKALLPSGGVRFSAMSKADRGLLLAEAGKVELEPRPRMAKPVKLSKGQTIGEAARQMLRECAAQIVANVDATRHLAAPEGPHQLRIGLRRLRTVLLILRPVFRGAAARHIAEEAQWLGQQVGELRNLDVILNDIIAREAKAHPDVASLQPLAETMALHAGNVRQDLRQRLAGQRVQSFIFDLMQFVETRGWIDTRDAGQTSRLAAPVRDLAAKVLHKRWKKVSECAKHIQDLSVEARHTLRKELKKLRYATEFLGPLYPAKKVKPFLANLRMLQDVFGDLNDAAMVKDILIHHPFPADKGEQVGLPIGWIAGACATRAELSWEHAKQLWTQLRDTRQFWH
jgi:triphosphatase